jgi:hemerythrin-like domain-containing protein
MILIDELVAEHDLIDRTASAFRRYVDECLAGHAPAADGAAFVRFFRLYAGDFHHAREEDVLFPALVERASLPGDRGPLAVLTADHRRMGAVLDRIDALVARLPLEGPDAEALRGATDEYTTALGHHIDAENSVLFPESEARLRKNGVRDLPSRAATPAEAEAGRAGAELAARYAAPPDRDVIRGDGCVLCPAMVEGCEGLEAEWWNESEWDECADHLASE